MLHTGIERVSGRGLGTPPLDIRARCSQARRAAGGTAELRCGAGQADAGIEVVEWRRAGALAPLREAGLGGARVGVVSLTPRRWLVLAASAAHRKEEGDGAWDGGCG